jgi:hypothetical protein
MKLKLTLTGGELEALVRIAGWIIRFDTNSFEAYSYLAALREFVGKCMVKYAIHVRISRVKKYKITLNDMQTLALACCLPPMLEYIPPYEEVLCRKIIAAIDLQFENERSLYEK